MENYCGSNLIGIIKVYLKVYIGCDECVIRRDVNYLCIFFFFLNIEYIIEWYIRSFSNVKGFDIVKKRILCFKNSLMFDKIRDGEINCMYMVLYVIIWNVI